MVELALNFIFSLITIAMVNMPETAPSYFIVQHCRPQVAYAQQQCGKKQQSSILRAVCKRSKPSISCVSTPFSQTRN